MKIKEEIKNILYNKKGYETYHQLFMAMFISIIIINPIQIVSAESGSIVISDYEFLEYECPNTLGVGNNQILPIIYYDAANFNYIDSFHVHPRPGYTNFVHSYESTTFQFVSGATGGTGYVWYDRNLSAVYYMFPTDMIATSSPITISLTKDIFVNITYIDGRCTIGKTVVSPTNPVWILGEYDYPVPGNYHDVYVAITSTDYYTVSYLSQGLFSLSITKNPYVDTKYFINGILSRYSEETTFNKINIVDSIFTYADGLYLNATLSSGVYTNTLINSTIVSGVGQKFYTLSFNKSFYSLGEQTNISYTTQTLDLTNNFYRIKVFNMNDMLNAEYTSPNIVSESGFVLPSIYDKTKVTAFYAKLYSFAYNDSATFYSNRVLLSSTYVAYGVNVSDIKGNISTDKGSYNTTETIIIKYNTSVDGRIRIRDGLVNFWFLPVIAGNNQEKQFYISSSDEIGTWELLLQNYMGTWDTINSTAFTVQAHESRIDFDKTNYRIGDVMTITSWSSTPGYVSLFDSNNVVKSNFTTSAGNININTYYLSQSSLSGTYTVKLYNNTSLLVSSDTSLVEFDVIPEPIIIPITPTVTEIKGLIDIGDQIGIAIFGNMDKDNSGDYSDSEIIKTGNSIFMTLLVISLFLLIGGSYKFLTGKR